MKKSSVERKELLPGDVQDKLIEAGLIQVLLNPHYIQNPVSDMERDRGLVIIASRKSALAMYQSELVMKQLQEAHPTLRFAIETYSTKGDRILDVSLNKIGDKGLFTKELEVALQEDRADIAVHSLKDMPTLLPEGLVIGAITEREDSSDAVVLHARHQVSLILVIYYIL